MEKPCLIKSKNIDSEAEVIISHIFFNFSCHYSQRSDTQCKYTKVHIPRDVKKCCRIFYHTLVFTNDRINFTVVTCKAMMTKYKKNFKN